MVNVNTHIHTPYSFSSFDSIEQAVSMAKKEKLSVLGINDSCTMEGFSEFGAYCREQGIYPLFNIEFATISKEDKLRGYRWNDQFNPGVIYLCGKGLSYSPDLSIDTRNLMASIWKGTQDRIWRVLGQLNEYLRDQGVEITLTYNEIRKAYSKNSVKGQHIAKALHLALLQKWSDPLKLSIAYKRLFDDASFSADPADSVNMQNEIRSRLLKSEKIAQIKERHETILGFQEARALILEAGGIPCYLLLGDDKAGFTEYEKNVSMLAKKLTELKIFAVEFLPWRNSIKHLKSYAGYLRQKGFCVTFGTDHNSFGRGSLIPVCRGGVPFDKELKQIAFEGACIVAAHQERHSQFGTGFIDEWGDRSISADQMKSFIGVGDEVIRRATKAELVF